MSVRYTTLRCERSSRAPTTRPSSAGVCRCRSRPTQEPTKRRGRSRTLRIVSTTGRTTGARKRNKPPFRLTLASVPPRRAPFGPAPTHPRSPLPPTNRSTWSFGCPRSPKCQPSGWHGENPARPPSPRPRSAPRRTSPVTPSALHCLHRSATRPTPRRRRVAAHGSASTEGPAPGPEQERRSTRRDRGGSGAPTPPR